MKLEPIEFYCWIGQQKSQAYSRVFDVNKWNYSVTEMEMAIGGKNIWGVEVRGTGAQLDMLNLK